MAVYTIGQAAEMTGLSVSTLRYYEKEGLLPFVERTGGGRRVFSDEDFRWLSIIECLKGAGVPIREIRQYIDWCLEGDATLDRRRDFFLRQKARVEAQIAEYRRHLDKIEYKIWYYGRAIERGTEDGQPSNCGALEAEYRRLKETGDL